mmetsp:Transcript_24692/g.71387  ORF Transcript_24692/g.71387 Transcript_24692/m.71387 type:complete len:508 (-) Transcript_24692:7-1530(-)
MVLIVGDEAARAAKLVVGPAFAHALGAAEVDERERRFHKPLLLRRALAKAQNHDRVGAGTALVHRRPGLALHLLAPLEHVLEGLSVGDRHLAAAVQDVAVAHPLLGRTVRGELTSQQVCHRIPENLHIARPQHRLEARGPAHLQGLEDFSGDARHEAAVALLGEIMRTEHRVSLPAAGLAVDDERAARAVDEVAHEAQAARDEHCVLLRRLVENVVELPAPKADARRDGQHGAFGAGAYREYRGREAVVLPLRRRARSFSNIAGFLRADAAEGLRDGLGLDEQAHRRLLRQPGVLLAQQGDPLVQREPYLRGRRGALLIAGGRVALDRRPHAAESLQPRSLRDRRHGLGGGLGGHEAATERPELDEEFLPVAGAAGDGPHLGHVRRHVQHKLRTKAVAHPAPEVGLRRARLQEEAVHSAAHLWHTVDTLVPRQEPEDVVQGERARRRVQEDPAQRELVRGVAGAVGCARARRKRDCIHSRHRSPARVGSARRRSRWGWRAGALSRVA